MSISRRPVTLMLALVAILALVAAACSSSSSSGGGDTSPEPAEGGIKIAVEGPASGSQGTTGVDMFRAAQLAVEEANANGGVAGEQVELVQLDDAADPEKGIENANQAVADGVFAVVGPYNSSVGVENLPIYMEGGVLPIHLTSTADTDSMGFTIQPKDYQVAPVEAEAISGWLKAERVAILFDRSSYTAGIAKQLKGLLEKDGVDVVAYLRFRDSNLVPGNTIRRAMQGDPDLIYSSTYFPQGARLAPGITKQNVTCFMGLANQDPEFIERAGLKVSEECLFSGVPSPDQFPGAVDYVAAYEAKFNNPPGTWGTFTYDSFNLLFDAVEQAGSWDADQVNDILAGTAGFEGVTGPITIDAELGNRSDVPVVVLQVDNSASFIVDPKWATFAGFPAA